MLELHHPACQPLPGSSGKLSSPFPLLPQALGAPLPSVTKSQRLFCRSRGAAIPSAPDGPQAPRQDLAGYLEGKGPPGQSPHSVPEGISTATLGGAAYIPLPLRRGTQAWFWSPGRKCLLFHTQPAIYDTVPGQGFSIAIFPHLPCCFGVRLIFHTAGLPALPGCEHTLHFPQGTRDSLFPTKHLSLPVSPRGLQMPVSG